MALFSHILGPIPWIVLRWVVCYPKVSFGDYYDLGFAWKREFILQIINRVSRVRFTQSPIAYVLTGVDCVHPVVMFRLHWLVGRTFIMMVHGGGGYGNDIDSV